MTLSVPSRRSTPRGLARLALVAVAVFAAVAPATVARAAPSPSDIERQIDEAWNKLEPIIEQYNQVHGQLAANQAKAAQLRQRLQPLQLQVDVAMSRTGEYSAWLYKSGPAATVNALLSTGSPDSLVAQLLLLDQMARRQNEQMRDVVSLRDRYAVDQAALDQVVTTLQRQDADLAARKTEIEKKLADLQRLRQQAYGSAGAGGSLRPVACPVDYLGGPGGVAAARACALIGKPYIWGAAGPYGYDCSGLTLAAWAAAGVSLPHYTVSQWNITRPVSRVDARPGDLVFFFSDLHHVGLYVGGGWMVHAPTTGDYVRMARIDSPYLPIAGFRRPG